MSKPNAEEILKKIKKMERGLFSVNSDEALTREVEEIIQDSRNSRKDKVAVPVEDDIKYIIDSERFVKDQFKRLSDKAITNIVPRNFRLRFVKRVINRLIKTFTRQQVEFNFAAVSSVKALMDRINLVFKTEAQHFLEQEEKIHDSQQVVYMINSKMDTHLNMFTLLRDELFYELDHKVKNMGIVLGKKETESLFKESYGIKTQKNEGKVKLNLGSGPFDVPGYINVDFRDLPNVDIVADVTNLPFKKGQVDEIYTSHLLEHFPLMQLKKDILPNWRELLKQDGKITIIVPDIAEMAKLFASGGMVFDDFARVVMGAQEYDGNYHYAVFSEQSVCNILSEIGFTDIEVLASKRKNDICLEMEIVAYKR